MPPFARLIVLGVAAAPLPGPFARAQCTPDWDEAFGVPGMTAEVYVLRALETGPGTTVLAAGGAFASAGGVPASRIALWDGAVWSALGGGFDGPGARIRSLASIDEGEGHVIYAGGFFETADGAPAGNIARWNGSAWEAIGDISGTVLALLVHDLGEGPVLLVGGTFTTAGGITARRIAVWDGDTWSTLGGGMNYNVRALTLFDAGGGTELYAAGAFSVAGGQPAGGIARWDGAHWQPLGEGIDGDGLPVIYALAVFDDGGGPAIYAGGRFETAGGAPASNIARWNGASWSPLGEGTDGAIHSLSVFDDGAGAALYAGGDFTMAGGAAADSLARWDGGSWSAVAGGLNSDVLALLAYDDGGGDADDLYCGGFFSAAGGDVPSSRIARLNGCNAGSPAELLDVAVEFGTHLSGGLADLDASDDSMYVARSAQGLSAFEPNLLELVIGAMNTAAAPSSIDIAVESRINNPGGAVRVRLRNWSSGAFEQVDQFSVGTTELVHTTHGAPAADRVRASDDRIELSLRYSVVATFSLAGFGASLDFVGIDVE
jgi:hypothetical protein